MYRVELYVIFTDFNILIECQCMHKKCNENESLIILCLSSIGAKDLLRGLSDLKIVNIPNKKSERSRVVENKNEEFLNYKLLPAP